MFSNTTAICAAELLVRALTHVCNNETEGKLDLHDLKKTMWMQTGYCACTHRTAHRCCLRSRCHRHSATGCGYSSHFGNGTRPLRTPWELERVSKEEGERFDRTNNEYAGKKKYRYWNWIQEESAITWALWTQCSQLCWHQENVTFSVRLRARIFTQKNYKLSTF